MKNRQSLVSNSSSSSFVLLGVKVSPKKLTRDELESHCVAVGPGYDSEVSIFKINDSAMLKFVQDFSDRFEVYQFCQISYGEEIEINLDNYPKDVKVIVRGGECDQDNTENVQDLMIVFSSFLKDRCRAMIEERYKNED